MDREDDNYLEETVISEIDENGIYSKTALLMNDNVRFGKYLLQRSSRDGTITRRLIRYTFSLNVDTLGKAFYDAYIMTYLPNITKRYQDQRENEVIEDIYGNKIKFVYDSIYAVFIEPNVTVELEQLYDKLTAEVLEKVRTYGRDMEISRWD